jgi:tetrahydromethanopterin S-methyltransferase subunit B
MSAINLSMVVEVDTKQLEAMREKMDKLDAQLLEKLEKASISMTKLLEKAGYTWLDKMNKLSKSFSNMVEVSKIGTVAIFKQLEGVNEKLQQLIKSFDDLNIKLSKSSSGSNSYFNSTTSDVLSSVAALTYLKGTIGNVKTGFVTLGVAAGLTAKIIADIKYEKYTKAMSETAKIAHEQDRILDALKATAKEGNTESQMLLQKLSGLVKYYGDSEKALKVFMSTDRLYYDQMIKITDAYHKEKDAAKEAADSKKYLSLLFGDLTNASDELNSKTGELSKTNALWSHFSSQAE